MASLQIPSRFGPGISTTQDSNIEVIAPDGDFILKAGRENTVEFKVSSTRLREVSTTLRQNLNTIIDQQPQGSKVINFPQDNPDAMREILKMLHLRPSSGQVKVWSADKILEFASTLKRYDLVNHLRYQAHAILMDWLREYEFDERLLLTVCGDIVAAAYLLDHKKAFFLATKQLMRSCVGDFAELADGRCGRDVPAKALIKLDHVRKDAHHEATYCLITFLNRQCLECRTDIKADNNGIWEHARKHFGTDTWPPPLTGEGAWSLQAIIDKTKTLGDYSYTTGCEEHQNMEIVETTDFEWLADEAEDIAQGLCLTCVQTFKIQVDGPAECTDPAHDD
ncbi:hypothetical protein HII31_01058 [Pseudocercospora fuligena]|uniref:BTB domain-containing protein n=1 Tax=Pseudocercospora fuligena TaxID=685502 RepID=A0A8H6VSV2_9PEZI|nr:hypothetical protein HII31_01058 [Pseudocercospora fuligena]